MINLGIIGCSEGNGHPYSYSAIFNGYNPKMLQKNCPYNLIKNYLPKFHKNRNSIKHANISHIWTQEKLESLNISQIARIPNISKNVDELINNVDGIILARDDPYNYFKILKKIILSRKPLFVDKQFVHNHKNFLFVKDSLNKNQIFNFGSAIKYSKKILKIKRNSKLINNTNIIFGKSKSTFLKYGNHLLDGIFEIFKNDVICISNHFIDNVENIQIICKNNLKINLKFSNKYNLPIYFNLLNNNEIMSKVKFEDYFFIYKKMLERFMSDIKNYRNTRNYDRNYKITKIILAGEISKKNKGKKVYFSSI